MDFKSILRFRFCLQVKSAATFNVEITMGKALL